MIEYALPVHDGDGDVFPGCETRLEYNSGWRVRDTIGALRRELGNGCQDRDLAQDRL